MKKLPFKPTALRRLNATASSSSPGPSATPDKPPATTTTTTPATHNEDDDGLALFRRSKEMAPKVAAHHEEQIRRKQRKAEKEREKEAERRAAMRLSEPKSPRQQRKRSSLDDDPFVIPHLRDQGEVEGEASGPSPVHAARSTELVTPPPSKRTRTDDESTGWRSSGRKTQDSAPEPEASPSTRWTRRSTVEEGTSSAPLVLLDSDSEDAAQAPPTRRRRRSSSSSIHSIPQQETITEVIEEEDDDVAKYIKIAEENRARMLAQQNASANAKPRKVDILISSPIPGSKPCQIKYFFDKPLVLVRNAWIQRQEGVAMPATEELILTWRCGKVYNNSSLLDLGIRPFGEYGVFAEGGSSGLDETKVHLQIWTSKLLEDHLAKEQRRRKRAAGDVSDDDDDASDEAQAQEPVEERRKFKVSLKARDYEEMGLTVLLETTVETLMTAFRSHRAIPSEKEISLRFDGDQLEEHVTMEEAGVDEMDTIEVHIK
jgi:hypothetical protein